MNPLTPGSIQYDIATIIDFINRFLVPFVFALAFALFLFGVFKYFFLDASKDPKARGEGSKFIFGAVIAFAVMLSVWGLVNIVRGTIPGLSSGQPPLPTFNGTSGTNGAQTQSQPTGIPAAPNSVPATSNNGSAPCTDAERAVGGEFCNNSSNTNGSNNTDPVNSLY